MASGPGSGASVACAVGWGDPVGAIEAGGTGLGEAPPEVAGAVDPGSGDGDSIGLVQPARTTAAARMASGLEGRDVGVITRTQTSVGRRV